MYVTSRYQVRGTRGGSPTVLFALLAVTMAWISTGLPIAMPNAEVHLPFGTVRGNVNALGREFLGIPFAAKPERFEAPRPWTDRYKGERLDATSYSAQCWQPPTPGDLFNSTAPMSEDCLHLNLFVPRTEPSPSLLPVMVWIHGGSLQYGTAMSPIYNASRLAAAQNTLVVAINYRLNVMGFQPVTLPDGTVSSNNGFKDQQQALRWVQEHIAAFGGNSSQVTVFGESAGAQSVIMHSVSPLSAGLLHSAISESGPATSFQGLSSALKVTSAMAADVCGDVSNSSTALFQCLKTADASAMFDAVMASSPDALAVFGDAVLPAAPVELVQRGMFNRVAFILGTNADEASLFVDGSARYTAERARCIVEGAVAPNIATSLMEMYPVVGTADNRDSVVQMVSDLLIVCPTRHLASALAAAGAAPWVYEFTRRPSCPMYNRSGAFHTTEIPYVFDNVEGVVGMANSANQHCRVAADDLELASVVSSLWGAFARQGEAVAAWPRFEFPRQEMVTLDVGASNSALDTRTGYSMQHRCSELERLGLTVVDSANIMGAASKCLPTAH